MEVKLHTAGMDTVWSRSYTETEAVRRRKLSLLGRVPGKYGWAAAASSDGGGRSGWAVYGYMWHAEIGMRDQLRLLFAACSRT